MQLSLVHYEHHLRAYEDFITKDGKEMRENEILTMIHFFLGVYKHMRWEGTLRNMPKLGTLSFVQLCWILYKDEMRETVTDRKKMGNEMTEIEIIHLMQFYLRKLETDRMGVSSKYTSEMSRFIVCM